MLLTIPILGAGCFGSSSSSSSDGGVFKSVTAGDEWGQVIVVPTAQGIGTLATTDVLNMEMDPQDHEFIYLGTRDSGLLYSEDSGASWRQSRYSALKSDTVFDIEVDPTDVCSIYIAKGQRLYRTTDCMRTFDSETYVENRSDVNVIKVAVDWYDHEIIWVGLSNGDILKSNDAGNTWYTSLKTGSEISAILISNVDSRNVLVSTFDDGLFKTTDRGDAWEEINGNIKDLKDAKDIYTLIQSEDAGVVIAATAYGLLRSKDFGSTWEAIELVTSPGQMTIRVVGMDVEDPDTLYYAASGTFYRSTDGGVTWNTERLATTRVPRALLVDPEDPAVLYVGVAADLE